MFRFSLQATLNLREKTEQTKKRELGLLNNAYQHKEQECAVLLQAIQDTYKQLKSVANGVVDYLAQQQYLNYLHKQHRDEKALKDDMLKLQKQIDIKKEELAEAVKERKILQNLKERKYLDYLQEEKAREQKQVDELISYQYTQKRKGDGDGKKVTR